MAVVSLLSSLIVLIPASCACCLMSAMLCCASSVREVCCWLSLTAYFILVLKVLGCSLSCWSGVMLSS